MILSDEEIQYARNITVNCTHCFHYIQRNDRFVFNSCCSKCLLLNNNKGVLIPELKDNSNQYKFEPSDEWLKALKRLIKMKKEK